MQPATGAAAAADDEGHARRGMQLACRGPANVGRFAGGAALAGNVRAEAAHTANCAAAPANLFNSRRVADGVADVFDAIPALVVALFAAGLVGVMVYERSRARLAQAEGADAGAGAGGEGDAGDAASPAAAAAGADADSGANGGRGQRRGGRGAGRGRGGGYGGGAGKGKGRGGSKKASS